MSMIRRYIAREIVGAVLFVLAGFLGLFAFFDFINEIDDVGQAGYRHSCRPAGCRVSLRLAPVPPR